MNLTNALAGLSKQFRDVDQKAVNTIVDYSQKNGVSFKASAEHIAESSEDAERLADKAFDKAVVQCARQDLGLPEEDAKGVRDVLREMRRNPENFDNQRSFIQWLERIEADQSKMDDLNINESDISRAKDKARSGNVRGAAAVLFGGQSLGDKIVERISEFVDSKADTGDSMPEDENEETNNDPLEHVDGDLADAVRSVADNLDEDDPVEAIRKAENMLSSMDDGGDGVVEAGADEDQKAEGEDDDRQTTKEELAEKYDIPVDAVNAIMDKGDTKSNVDEKLDSFVTESDLEEFKEDTKAEVVDAITSEDVLGPLAQKLSQNEEFQESVVETVDQKGDFTTTGTPRADADPEMTLREAVERGDDE